VVTKLDLADACEFDHALAEKNIQAVRPGIAMLELSSKTGRGMDAWMDLLAARRKRASQPA